MKWIVVFLMIVGFGQVSHANGLSFEQAKKITCDTLGSVGECENTSLCALNYRSYGTCVSTNNDPAWAKQCSVFPAKGSCEYAPSLPCKWSEETSVECRPR